MASVVRVFAYSAAIKVRAEGQQFSSDSFMMDKLPYLDRWNLTVDDAAATSTDEMPDGTEYVLVQVEPGKRVFYEVNNSGHTTTADTSSPYIIDDVRIKCGPGHTLSFRDYPIV